MTPTFWRELQDVLDEGFTGQLVLHCSEGQVVKYERNETLRPREKNGLRRVDQDREAS